MPKLGTRDFRKKIQRISDQGVLSLKWGAHNSSSKNKGIPQNGRKKISDGRYEEGL